MGSTPFRSASGIFDKGKAKDIFDKGKAKDIFDQEEGFCTPTCGKGSNRNAPPPYILNLKNFDKNHQILAIVKKGAII